MVTATASAPAAARTAGSGPLLGQHAQRDRRAAAESQRRAHGAERRPRAGRRRRSASRASPTVAPAAQRGGHVLECPGAAPRPAAGRVSGRASGAHRTGREDGHRHETSTLGSDRCVASTAAPVRRDAARRRPPVRGRRHASVSAAVQPCADRPGETPTGAGAAPGTRSAAAAPSREDWTRPPHRQQRGRSASPPARVEIRGAGRRGADGRRRGRCQPAVAPREERVPAPDRRRRQRAPPMASTRRVPPDRRAT